MAQKVTIDGKEYDLERLPKEAIDFINSILFVDKQIKDKENEIKVLLAARQFYFENLTKLLNQE
jgi:hypothetical protein